MQQLMRLIYLCGCLCWVQPALAWGKLGHQIVASVAWHYLSASDRRTLMHFSAGRRLVTLSNWPDWLRADQTKKKYRTWHYLNVRDGISLADFPAMRPGHIGWALVHVARCWHQKRRCAPYLTRPWLLAWTVHLVADAHQPCHVGRMGDRGMGRCWVYFHGQRINLHRVWDSILIEAHHLGCRAYVQRLLQRHRGQYAKVRPVELRQWLWESYQLRRRVYPVSGAAYCVYGHDPGSKVALPHLSTAYIHQSQKIIDDRLYQAGVRLAQRLTWLLHGTLHPRF
jgi:hypothetical protein